MYNFLLEANEAGTTLNPDFMARLGEATAVLIQGMLTVFAVLCIIWFCLVVMRIFVHDIPERRKKAAAEATEALVSAPVAETAPADDGELIAVIAAAVAAYRADDEGGFRVVSFHRVNK